MGPVSKKFNLPISQHNALTLLLIGVVLASGLIGCGPKTISSNNTSGQFSFASTSTTTSTTNSGVMASCSHDIDNKANISLRAMAVTNGSTLDATKVRVKFDRFPTTFSNSSVSTLRFYPFTYNTSAVSSAASQLNFSMEVKSGGSFMSIYNGSLISEVSSSQLVAAANAAGVAGTTASEVLAYVNFNLMIDDTSSDMITAVTYEGTSSGYTDRIDILKPRFLANPSEYAGTGRPAVLQGLHPLQYMINGGWTNDQFKTESDRYCF